MAKPKIAYVCTECGGQTLKWQGQCPHCSGWNTLVEAVAEKAASRFAAVGATSEVRPLSEVQVDAQSRIGTGIGELDRVLGGGFVRAAWC